MRERSRILSLWMRARARGEEAVLATVVKTEGSSYRMPGARLILTQGGSHEGGVSGGCLEDDILKKAWWLTESGPVLRRYDTTPDDELSNGGYGLGCNGIIQILLERVNEKQPSVLPVLEAVGKLRLPAYLAHVLSPREAVGQRVAMGPDGVVQHNLDDPELVRSILALMEAGLEESKLVSPLPGSEVFIERVDPPVQLLVYGAGVDAIPMTELAGHLGWQVHVLDGRAHYARRDKFPEAESVSVRAPGSPAPQADQWTAAILMTHSFSQDADVLRSLADSPVFYLGVLGPRKRTIQLLEEAAISGVASQGRLHAPMGLDIGADGPEQVALAVISEIQSVMNGRTAGRLRDRSGPIHRPAPGEEENEAGAWVRSIVCA